MANNDEPSGSFDCRLVALTPILLLLFYPLNCGDRYIEKDPQPIPKGSFGLDGRQADCEYLFDERFCVNRHVFGA